VLGLASPELPSSPPELPEPDGATSRKEAYMADSQKSMVTIVAIIAIVILVGLVAYFVMQETNDTIEIDFGSAAPEWVVASANATQAPEIRIEV